MRDRNASALPVGAYRPARKGGAGHVPLMLTRAQRRGVPVMAQSMTATLRAARNPRDYQAVIDHWSGLMGIMCEALRRRGWASARQQWVTAHRAGNGKGLRASAEAMAQGMAEAERAIYRLARDAGEAGGSARSRGRGRRR